MARVSNSDINRRSGTRSVSSTTRRKNSNTASQIRPSQDTGSRRGTSSIGPVANPQPVPAKLKMNRPKNASGRATIKGQT